MSDRSSAKNNYPINGPAMLNTEFVELPMKQGLRIEGNRSGILSRKWFSMGFKKQR